MNWFDTHLDLACIALVGRDMRAADPAAAGGENPPGAITFPSLSRGRVRACLGTIFIEPDGVWPAISYRSLEAPSAHRAAMAQLALYDYWHRAGLINLVPGSFQAAAPSLDKLTLGILIEGADGILSPADLSWWQQRGVVAIGLAWAKQTRFAGGNTTSEGLSDLGRELVKEMDRLGVVHDASHLSDRALADLFDLTDRPVIASHSNCRALIDAPGDEPRQRHLTDDAIREITRRGGMIGVNLYSPFIIRGAERGRRASIAEWCQHVDHICAIAGNRTQVGLGSDADGGFSCLTLPDGVNAPQDYGRLLEGLQQRNWSEADLSNFAWNNWAKFWRMSCR